MGCPGLASKCGFGKFYFKGRRPFNMMIMWKNEKQIKIKHMREKD